MLTLERYTSSMVLEDAPPLPKALQAEPVITKVLYCYLEPLGEVEVSVQKLEDWLGISHRAAYEALKRLQALELLEVVQEPTNKAGRYRIVQ